MSDEILGAGKFRALTGPARALEGFLLCALAVAGAAWAGELHVQLGLVAFKEQYLGLVLALALPAVFLGVKARRAEPGNRVPWHDWLLALCGAAAGG